MYNEKIEKAAGFAYSFKETVYHSYDCAKRMIAEGVKGCFVECGVAAGSQIAAMQVAILEEPVSDKIIYAFDSFEGIPMAGEFDTEQAGIGAITHDKFAPLSERLVSSGITVHSEENVRLNFQNIGLPVHNVRFIKGWFQNTLPEVSHFIEDISILRLDGDLHESTLVCLQYLYPKVSEGGIVIIDDYALEGCRVAVRQYFESINIPLPEMLVVEGGGGGVVWFVKAEKKEELVGKFDISLYNDDFFKWHLEHARQYSIDTMNAYMDKYSPKSVVDFGCGIGSYLESAIDKGAFVKGFDIGGEHARKYTPEFLRPFIEYKDCTQPIECGKHDCVISFETAEHIEPSGTDTFIDNICNACSNEGVILFTAAPPEQDGCGHINCYPIEYWIEQFDKRGFYYDMEMTEQIIQSWVVTSCPTYILTNLMTLKRK